MTVWLILLIASAAVYLLKLSGYLVPPSLVERPTPRRVSNLLTVALLAALIGVQTFERSHELVLDARVPAVLLAAVLFAFRVPFIVVIIAAAACAALLRLAGLDGLARRSRAGGVALSPRACPRPAATTAHRRPSRAS